MTYSFLRFILVFLGLALIAELKALSAGNYAVREISHLAGTYLGWFGAIAFPICLVGIVLHAPYSRTMFYVPLIGSLLISTMIYVRRI